MAVATGGFVDDLYHHYHYVNISFYLKLEHFHF